MLLSRLVKNSGRRLFRDPCTPLMLIKSQNSQHYLYLEICLFYFNRSHPRSVSASTHRPFSAKHTMTPSPPSSERSSSARVRPASARPRPASAKPRPVNAMPRAAGARPRPASARLTYSSHRDYIVNTACRDIPQSPTQASSFKVGETKTSQLRLSLRKKTSDWMLKETREYISKRPEDFKQRQQKRKNLLLPTVFET